MTKRLCIIPARGGSKRVPDKNIRDFCGKPMISHALSTAKETRLFDTIHVSTDSDKIINVAHEYGCPVDFKRPAELSDDHTPIMPVVKYVLSEFKQNNISFDTIVLIYATSPLITINDLKGAITQFEAGDQEKALLAVTPYPTPIEKAWQIKDKNTLIQKDKNAFAKRTQDIQDSYYDAGMFCIYTPEYILESQGAANTKGFSAYIVPEYRVTDIDTPQDWQRAELLFKALQLQSSTP